MLRFVSCYLAIIKIAFKPVVCFVPTPNLLCVGMLYVSKHRNFLAFHFPTIGAGINGKALLCSCGSLCNKALVPTMLTLATGTKYKGEC